MDTIGIRTRARPTRQKRSPFLVDPVGEALPDLLRSCCRGDPAAWQVLYEWYLAPCVPRWLRVHGLSAEERADVFQDFCAHLFTHQAQVLGRYRPQPGARFTSWLFAVFRNFLRDWLRTESRYRRGLALAGELLSNRAPACPEEQRALLAAVLEPPLRALPPSQRQALLLRYVADLPHAAIAERMGITEANAQVLVHRAKKALAARLSPEMRGDVA